MYSSQATFIHSVLLCICAHLCYFGFFSSLSLCVPTNSHFKRVESFSCCSISCHFFLLSFILFRADFIFPFGKMSIFDAISPPSSSPQPSLLLFSVSVFLFIRHSFSFTWQFFFSLFFFCSLPLFLMLLMLL